MKRFFAGFSVLFLSLAGFQPSYSATDDLSFAANAAFNDVSRCLTSGKDKKLDVYYLIDTSGSLEWTDPDNQRREILESSISQLGGFASEGIETSIKVTFFETNLFPVLDWTPVPDRAESARLAGEVGSRINNANAGGKTDWEEGLESAYDSLTSRGDSCKMLVWFTDGGINPTGEVSDTFDSLSRLCRPGIGEQSLGEGSFGLMSAFKEAQIPVFGVLYANIDATFEYWSELSGDEAAQEIVDEESWYMSFMQPLVEGSGSIGASRFGGDDYAGGSIECADVNDLGVAPLGQANGAFLNADDPVALAYQFLKLQAQITGGSNNQTTEDGFVVPEGAAKFTLIFDSESWSLQGPEGSGLDVNSDQAPESIRVESSGGATAITVNVLGNENYSGQWGFEHSGSEFDLFVYSGLTIELDRDRSSKVLSDFENTLTGRITRTSEFAGFPIRLDSYPNKELSLLYRSGGELVPFDGVTVETQNQGEFVIEGFNPASGQESISLNLGLDLGPNFASVESEFVLEVQDKNALARPATDSIQLSTLIGPNGQAAGQFIIEGPNTSSTSQFCFGGEFITLQDNQTGVEKIDRLQGFQFSVNGNPITGQPICFDVSQDGTLPVEIVATNPTQANSEVVAILPVTSTTVGAQSGFEAPVRISFASETESNQAVVIAAILGLLALGLILPLAGLSLINFLTTRFLPVEGGTRASYPVKIQPGQSARLVSADSGQSITVGPKDFGFINPQGSSKIFDTGNGLAKARVPLMPLFSSPWYEWQAPAGHRIISGYGSPTKSTQSMKAGKAAEVSPNVLENWSLLIKDEELTKTSADEIEAELIVFAPAGTLKDYQSKVSSAMTQTGMRSKINNLSEKVMQEQKSATDAADSPEANEVAPAVPGVPPPTSSSVPKPPGSTGGAVPPPPPTSGSSNVPPPPSGGPPKPPSPPKPPRQS